MSKSARVGVAGVFLCVLSLLATTPAEAPARTGGPGVFIRAADRGAPWIHVHDGRELAATYRSDAGRFEPSSLSPAGMTSADVDGDGLADLIAAHAGPEVSWLTLHRANPDARAPGKFDTAPFLFEALAVALPAAPRFLAAGDLDGDRHADVIVADGADEGLWWLPGSYNGALGAPSYLPLPGRVTALVTGDDDPGDGCQEILVAVRAAQSSHVLVLGHHDGALRVESSRFATEKPVTHLALGRLDDNSSPDLAVAAGRELTLLPGGAPPRHRSFSAGIRTMAFGDFAEKDARARGLVLSLDDGTVRLLTSDADADRVRILEQAPVSPEGSGSLATLNISNRPGDDIVAIDRGGRSLAIHVGGLPGEMWTSFDAIASVTAIQPMMLNDDIFSDLVVQLDGSTAPVVLMSGPDGIFTVDSTGDEPDVSFADGICQTAGGACTLRAAIEQANASAGTDAIGFNIPGGATHIIQPADALPPITDPLILDGTTEPDWAGIPVIEVDGSAAGSVDGLLVLTGSTTIEGLVINRFAGSGVVLSGVDAVENRIQRNYIGTNADGNAAARNLGDGVLINAGASLNVIGTDGDGVADDAEGNLISGNGNNGVVILDADTDGNVVAGNFLGTDASGSVAIANGGFGVSIVNSPDLNLVGTNGDGVSDVEERNVISGNDVRGVLLADAVEGNAVAGNYIGTDVTGSLPLPNAGGGIEISNGARFSRIGTDADGLSDDVERNVISGNGEQGITMFGSPDVVGTTIAGNYIGVAADGATALGNADNGISIGEATDTLIGGRATAARNVISGNTSNGVSVANTASATRVQGNYIGIDASGSAPLGNGGNGVLIVESLSNVVGTDGDGVDDALEGNVISGNAAVGVLIAFNATDNVVAGNYIGTDEAGVLAVPNGGFGVELSNGVLRTRVGTNTDGQSDTVERNVISGNGSAGISLFGSPSTDDNVIAGNFIGTQADGTSPLGNQSHGILINTDASYNTIGGTGTTPGSCDGPCNVIAFNGTGATLDGVRIVAGIHNAVIGNVIHSNYAGAGIDIDAAAATPNDPGDADGGANNGQNFPILTEATSSSGTTTVLGTLDSLASTDFRIELYSNVACDPLGYGEGETLVAVHAVTTGTDGKAGFSIPVTPEVPAGHWMSATATRMEGGTVPTDTSEFSPCLAVGPVTSAGTVPDGRLVPGIQLTAERGALDVVTILDWDASCVAADTDYAVYIGTLGDFTSHWARRCSTGGATTANLRSNEPALYYLVVPMSGNREGSYGTNSDDIERPPGVSVCHPQLTGVCD